MKELLQQLCDLLEKNTPVVLVSVVQHKGSTPRGGGSKMLVTEAGLVAGTIGGGLAEGMCIEHCAHILSTQQTEMKHFNLTGHMAAQSEMICGGSLDVLLCPLQGKDDLAFYTALLQNMQEDSIYVLQQINEQGEIFRSLKVNALWQKDISTKDTLSESEKNALLQKLPKGEESMLIEDKGQCFIVEKYISPWQMIILGGGHISRPTAEVASLAGFQVIVMDDREEFSQKERFPTAKATHTVIDFKNCFELCPPKANTCLVIVTRGHVHDKSVLEQALETEASYVGMIGSKRKREEVYSALKASGISQETLNQVKCPIGLNINAQTPEEIAISIVAECIAHKRSFSNNSL